MSTRRRSHLRRPHGLSINRMLPNILTMVALCAGLTSIRFALQAHWEAAVAAIFVAALLDGVDGRIARAIGKTSKFGGEFDSLADMVSFGVAPALLLYLWAESAAGPLGWIAVLIYTICAALRLAKFNAGQAETDDRPAWVSGYFIGIPSPAAAGLVMVPLLISFEFGAGLWSDPIVVGLWAVFIAAMMVAPIPTFSMKSARVPHDYMLPVLIVVGLFVASLVSAPWRTMLILGLIYVATIPASIKRFRRLTREMPVPVQRAPGNGKGEAGDDTPGPDDNGPGATVFSLRRRGDE